MWTRDAPKRGVQAIWSNDPTVHAKYPTHHRMTRFQAFPQDKDHSLCRVKRINVKDVFGIYWVVEWHNRATYPVDLVVSFHGAVTRATQIVNLFNQRRVTTDHNTLNVAPIYIVFLYDFVRVT